LIEDFRKLKDLSGFCVHDYQKFLPGNYY